MTKTTGFALLLACSLLSGCASQNLKSYQEQEPQWQVEEFFSGSLKAYGMVSNRSGTITGRFVADIDAQWQGDQGTLDEVFYWDDGREERRVWTLNRQQDGCYQAQANDTPKPTRLCTAGNALNMRYTLLLPWGNDGEISVNMDDWMYLLDSERLLNRTRISKFGFRVGEVILYIERVD